MFNFISLVFGAIANFCMQVILFLGYPGILILMMMESMILPVPSELVMPFAGFLAGEGKMSFALVVLFSSLGSLAGSLISYFMGRYGGSKVILRWGRYLLLDETDLEKTERWFERKGEKVVFISRFIPVVRHLISIPAGMGKMELKKFCFYTIIGATLWNAFLGYLGYLLGKNWGQVREYSEYVSALVAVVLVVLGAYFVYRHVRNKRQERNKLKI